MPPQNLTLNEIELIHEMTPFYQQNQEYCQKGAEILFGLLEQQPKKELISHIINRLGDLLKNWDMKTHRLVYLEKAISNIRNNKLVTSSFKMM